MKIIIGIILGIGISIAGMAIAQKTTTNESKQPWELGVRTEGVAIGMRALRINGITPSGKLKDGPLLVDEHGYVICASPRS